MGSHRLQAELRGAGNTPTHSTSTDSEGVTRKVPGTCQPSGAAPHERVREKRVWARRETMQTSSC